MLRIKKEASSIGCGFAKKQEPKGDAPQLDHFRLPAFLAADVAIHFWIQFDVCHKYHLIKRIILRIVEWVGKADG